mmetsp:Transcript_11394/g.23354  ORF Transcript_11394/g.23354 Transcript_11394/m.23354 type:complete len:94 (-) Transcript_11394:290-571(-)
MLLTRMLVLMIGRKPENLNMIATSLADQEDFDMIVWSGLQEDDSAVLKATHAARHCLCGRWIAATSAPSQHGKGSSPRSTRSLICPKFPNMPI